MIRAVVKDGIIQPLEPLPMEWQDGHPVVVDDEQESFANGGANIDQWADDMNVVTAELNNAEEWQEIEAALAEADRQSKAVVRREMGLP